MAITLLSSDRVVVATWAAHMTDADLDRVLRLVRRVRYSSSDPIAFVGIVPVGVEAAPLHLAGPMMAMAAELSLVCEMALLVVEGPISGRLRERLELARTFRAAFGPRCELLKTMDALAARRDLGPRSELRRLLRLDPIVERRSVG